MDEMVYHCFKNCSFRILWFVLPAIRQFLPARLHGIDAHLGRWKTAVADYTEGGLALKGRQNTGRGETPANDAITNKTPKG